MVHEEQRLKDSNSLCVNSYKLCPIKIILKKIIIIKLKNYFYVSVMTTILIAHLFTLFTCLALFRFALVCSLCFI